MISSSDRVRPHHPITGCTGHRWSGDAAKPQERRGHGTAQGGGAIRCGKSGPNGWTICCRSPRSSSSLYTLAAAIYIILENRSPQSTFAWLLLFILLPVVGIIVYRFVGRGWHAFSKEKALTRQELGGELLHDLGPLLGRTDGYIARIASDRPASYRGKLLRLSQRNDSSILTGHNAVTILQDAREKYPRLLADIRAARHHIHLNYYIWTEDSFTSNSRRR